MNLYSNKLDPKFINRLTVFKQKQVPSTDNPPYPGRCIIIVYGPQGSGKSRFVRKHQKSILNQWLDTTSSTPNWLYYYLGRALDERSTIVLEHYNLSDAQFNRTLEKIADCGIEVFITCQYRPKIENINGPKMIFQMGYPDFDYILSDGENQTKILLNGETGTI